MIHLRCLRSLPNLVSANSRGLTGLTDLIGLIHTSFLHNLVLHILQHCLPCCILGSLKNLFIDTHRDRVNLFKTPLVMSLGSPRGRSPIPAHPDQAPSRSLRSRSRQDSQPRSLTRSPSSYDAGRYEGRTRSRSRSESRGRNRAGRRYRSPSYSRSPARDPSPPRSAKVRVSWKSKFKISKLTCSKSRLS